MIDYEQIDQAIRLAQLEGLHTQLPEDELGHATVTRCRNIWWTLYIIDRQISAALGIPMTVQDFDISTLVNMPGETAQNTTLSLQVRLSQMMSSVLSRIFKTEKTQLGRFLDLTREILQTMACLAGEIEDAFPTGLHASMDTMSHEMRHVILLYHQVGFCPGTPALEFCFLGGLLLTQPVCDYRYTTPFTFRPKREDGEIGPSGGRMGQVLGTATKPGVYWDQVSRQDAGDPFRREYHSWYVQTSTG